MNLVLLTGTLTTDVCVQRLGDLDFVHMTVASDYRSRKGDLCTAHTPVTVYNGLARSLSCLGRGSLVTVTAHLENDVREPGTACSRHSEIVADSVEFLRVKAPLRVHVGEPQPEETEDTHAAEAA